ncbi:MAG: hypothetical protein Q8P95_01610 [bacterium]|nr:hypothetical protein [bacterium]
MKNKKALFVFQKCFAITIVVSVLASAIFPPGFQLSKEEAVPQVKAFAACPQTINGAPSTVCDVDTQFSMSAGANVSIAPAAAPWNFSVNVTDPNQNFSILVIQNEHPLHEATKNYDAFGIANMEGAGNSSNWREENPGNVALCVPSVSPLPDDTEFTVTCGFPANGFPAFGVDPAGAFCFLRGQGELIDTDDEFDNDTSNGAEQANCFLLNANNSNPSFDVVPGASQTVVRNSLATQDVDFTVTVSDPDDGDEITLAEQTDAGNVGDFTAPPLPQVSPATVDATYRITVAIDEVDDQTVTLRATDNSPVVQGLTDEVLTVVVSDPPPGINATLQAGSFNLPISPNQQVTDVFVGATNNGNPGEVIEITIVSGPVEAALLGGVNNPGPQGGAANDTIRFTIPPNGAGNYAALVRATNSINGETANVTITVSVGVTSGGRSVVSHSNDDDDDLPGGGEKDPCDDENIEEILDEYIGLMNHGGDSGRMKEIEDQMIECGYSIPGNEPTGELHSEPPPEGPQICENDPCSQTRGRIRELRDDSLQYVAMCKGVDPTQAPECQSFVASFFDRSQALFQELADCQAGDYPTACVPPAGDMNDLWKRTFSDVENLNKYQGAARIEDEEVIRLRVFNNYLNTSQQTFSEVKQTEEQTAEEGCANCNESPCLPCFIDMRRIYALWDQENLLLMFLALATTSSPPNVVLAEQIREQLRDIAEQMNFEARMIRLMDAQCRDKAATLEAPLCAPFGIPEIFPEPRTWVEAPCPECLQFAGRAMEMYNEKYVPEMQKLRDAVQQALAGGMTPGRILSSKTFQKQMEKLDGIMSDIGTLINQYLSCAFGRDDCPQLIVPAEPFKVCEEVCEPWYPKLEEQVEALCSDYVRLQSIKDAANDDKDGKKKLEELKKELEQELEQERRSLNNARQQKQQLRNRLRNMAQQGGGNSFQQYEQSGYQQDQFRLAQLSQQIGQMQQNPNLLNNPQLNSQHEQALREQANIQQRVDQYQNFRNEFANNLEGYEGANENIRDIEESIRQHERELRRAEERFDDQARHEAERRLHPERQEAEKPGANQARRDEDALIKHYQEQQAKIGDPFSEESHSLEQKIEEILEKQSQRQKKNKRKDNSRLENEMNDLEARFQELMEEKQACADYPCQTPSHGSELANHCYFYPDTNPDGSLRPRTGGPLGGPQTGADPADPGQGAPQGPDPGAGGGGGGTPGGGGGGGRPAGGGGDGNGTTQTGPGDGPARPDLPDPGGVPSGIPGGGSGGGSTTSTDPNTELLGGTQQGQPHGAAPGTQPAGTTTGTITGTTTNPPGATSLPSGGTTPGGTGTVPPPGSRSTTSQDPCEGGIASLLSQVNAEIQTLLGSATTPQERQELQRKVSLARSLRAQLANCPGSQLPSGSQTPSQIGGTVPLDCESIGQLRSQLEALEVDIEGAEDVVQSGVGSTSRTLRLDQELPRWQSQASALRAFINACEADIAVQTMERERTRTAPENALSTEDRYPHTSQPTTHTTEDDKTEVDMPIEGKVGVLVCGGKFLETYLKSYEQHLRRSLVAGPQKEKAIQSHLESLRDRLANESDPSSPICQNPAIACGIGARSRVAMYQEMLDSGRLNPSETTKVESNLNYLNGYLSEFCPQRNLSCSDLKQYGDTLILKKDEVSSREEESLIHYEIQWVEDRLKTIGCGQTTITDDRPFANYPHLLPPKIDLKETDGGDETVTDVAVPAGTVPGTGSQTTEEREQERLQTQLKNMPTDARFRVLICGNQVLSNEYIDSYERWGNRMVTDGHMSQETLNTHLENMRAQMNEETTEDVSLFCGRPELACGLAARSRLAMAEESLGQEGLSTEQRSNIESMRDAFKGFLETSCPPLDPAKMSCLDLFDYSRELVDRRNSMTTEEDRALLYYELQWVEDEFAKRSCISELTGNDCPDASKLSSFLPGFYKKMLSLVGSKNADKALKALLGNQISDAQFSELKSVLLSE